jgi:hypothetical protein
MHWPPSIKLRYVGDPNAGAECAETQLLLSLHSDGMTSTAEGRRVDAHLATCENCRKAFFWMRATHDVLAQRPAVLPPPDMSGQILRAIAEADGRERIVLRPRFNMRPVYAAAATVLIAAVATLSLTHLRNRAVTPASVSVAVVPNSAGPSAPSINVPAVPASPATVHHPISALHAEPMQVAARPPRIGITAGPAVQHGNPVWRQVASVGRRRSSAPGHILMARIPSASLSHRSARPNLNVVSAVHVARVLPLTHGGMTSLPGRNVQVAKVTPARSPEPQASGSGMTSTPSALPASTHLPNNEVASTGNSANNASQTPVPAAVQNPPAATQVIEVASVQRPSGLGDLQKVIGEKWRWADIHGSGAKPTRLDTPHGDIAPIVGTAID